MKKALLFLFTFILQFFSANAQEDALFDELESMVEVKKQHVIATFTSAKVILAPSIERVQKKQLHFCVLHSLPGFILLMHLTYYLDARSGYMVFA